MEQNKQMASDAQLKEILKAVSDAEVLVSDLSQGFKLSEISDLVALGTDLPPVIRDASVMLPQWEQLDDAARADLEAYVESNCVVASNTTASMWAQRVLNAAVALSAFYQALGL